VVSPDPELNSDAAEFFTRHVRIMEEVMKRWDMEELRPAVNAIREAFSADIRKPFVLKSTFPYGSPRPSDHSSPSNRAPSYRPALDRTGTMDQHLDAQSAHNVSYYGLPISPPVSTGALDSNGDSPSGQPLVMMSQAGQTPGLQQSMSLSEQPTWNPAPIFE
jgi:hypothetical protein